MQQPFRILDKWRVKMNIESEIDILTEITGTIDNYYGGGGQQEITGKPKILSSNYNMTQIQMTIKQRSDG